MKKFRFLFNFNFLIILFFFCIKLVVQKKRKEKKVTCDTWHVTCDMFGGLTFYQNFSSLALTVCDLCYYEDLEEKAHWLSDWINHEAVYRTAPATPGLLNTHLYLTLVVVVVKLSCLLVRKLDCVVRWFSYVNKFLYTTL